MDISQNTHTEQHLKNILNVIDYNTTEFRNTNSINTFNSDCGSTPDYSPDLKQYGFKNISICIDINKENDALNIETILNHQSSNNTPNTNGENSQNLNKNKNSIIITNSLNTSYSEEEINNIESLENINLNRKNEVNEESNVNNLDNEPNFRDENCINCSNSSNNTIIYESNSIEIEIDNSRTPKTVKKKITFVNNFSLDNNNINNNFNPENCKTKLRNFIGKKRKRINRLIFKNKSNKSNKSNESNKSINNSTGISFTEYIENCLISKPDLSIEAKTPKNHSLEINNGINGINGINVGKKVKFAKILRKIRSIFIHNII